MSAYRHLSWNLSVPEEWLIDYEQPFLKELLKKVINHHRLSDKVVITIKGVSAKIVHNGSTFWFEKIEEINDDHTLIIDYLIPENASIIKLEKGRPIYSKRKKVFNITTHQTQDHPFSELFDLRSNRHIVVTAAPNIKKIFELHGITGDKVYNYALETIYRTHKGLEPGLRRFIRPECKEHPFVTMKKISNDQWELECYQRLTRPQFAVTSCITSSIDC